MKTFQRSLTHSKLALSIKTAAILIIILAIYSQDLALVANEALHSEILSYILAIPLLFLYLIYRKRRMIRAAISFETPESLKKPTYIPEILGKRPTIPAYIPEILGALLCLTAFLLYWHGSYTFYPLEYHMLSLPIFLAGIILTMFNAKTLVALAFPIALLIFLTPPPQDLLNAVGAAISIISSESAYTILKAVGFPVTLTAQYGNPVIMLTRPDTSPIAFTIDIACAGFYSLSGFIVFATFIAYLAKARLPKKAVVFLTGIPLMLTLNIIRIVIIVVIGNQYGRETALQAFHLLGGWVLILLGAFILSIIAEKAFKTQLFQTKRKPPPCTYCNPTLKDQFCTACGRLLNFANIRLTKRDFSKIFTILVSAILILNIQVPVFTLTEGPVELNIKTLGGAETVTKMLPQMSGYIVMFVYRDRTFEEMAQQDASLIYGYSPRNTSQETIWVVIEIAKTRVSMHPWEICLITWQIAHGYQPQVTKLSQRDIHLLENPPVVARYFAFQDLKSGTTQVVLYLYECSFFNTGSSMEREYAKVSFITFADSPEQIPAVEAQLLPFGEAMADHWLPIKTWSLATLLISQNGLTLIAITMTLMALVLAYHRAQNQKQRDLNFKAYNRLVAKREKLILDAVDKTAAEQSPTAEAIARVYEELAGSPIDTGLLLEELSRADEGGFIRKDLTNQDDEPILTWRTWTPLSPPSKLETLMWRLLAYLSNLPARAITRLRNSLRSVIDHVKPHKVRKQPS